MAVMLGAAVAVMLGAAAAVMLGAAAAVAVVAAVATAVVAARWDPSCCDIHVAACVQLLTTDCVCVCVRVDTALQCGDNDGHAGGGDGDCTGPSDTLPQHGNKPDASVGQCRGGCMCGEHLSLL